MICFLNNNNPKIILDIIVSIITIFLSLLRNCIFTKFNKLLSSNSKPYLLR